MSRSPDEANTAVQKLLDQVDWKPVAIPGGKLSDGMPYATHTGEIVIGGVKIRVHQLNDGQRILDADAVAKLFGVE